MNGKPISKITDDGRQCTRCGIHKPWSSFHRSNGRAVMGRHSQCTDCMNHRKRSVYVHDPVANTKMVYRQKYGITEDDYDRMLINQRGLCDICLNQMRNPCIDHNHKTGKVRGLLCHGCNIKLAAIEQVEYRISAIAYLERYK